MDLDHHPGTRSPAGGPNFPTIITHASTFSFKKGRLALGKEYFSVHGLDLQTYEHRDVVLALEPQNDTSVWGGNDPMSGKFVRISSLFGCACGKSLASCGTVQLTMV